MPHLNKELMFMQRQIILSRAVKAGFEEDEGTEEENN